MEQIGNLLKRSAEFLANTPMSVVYCLAAYGFAITFKNLVYTPASQFYRYAIRHTDNLRAKYGQDSYVFITGASDGVGKALAYEFAKQGMNLIILARRIEALEDIKKDITEKYAVMVRTISFDLSTVTDENSLKSRVMQEVGDLDVSILVNNAGVVDRSFVLDMTSENFNRLVTINMLAPTYLTKLMLPQLMNREHRSAIMNISSILGECPMASVSTYSASKAYIRFFSYALAEEVKEKVDVMTVNLARTRTAMLGENTNWLTTVPEVAAAGMVKDLGRYRETDSCFRHFFGNFLMSPFSWEIQAKIRSSGVHRKKE